MTVHVETGTYPSGNLGVQLFTDEEYVATVSVYVAVPLATDEFVFKTYTENEGLLEQLLAHKIVELTGRSVALGFAGDQPICRLCSR